MAISVKLFVKRLSDSGLMTAGEVSVLTDSLPVEERPTNGQELALLLLRQKKLTKYQATAIYKGQTGGLVLGNYIVLDQIGEGGMGQVLKAQHKRMKRLVAVKVLPREVVGSPDALDRFLREVEAAAKLNHPNIVTAYDADEARGIHFLVMEHVEGNDLSVILSEHGPLPLEQAIECTLHAARGLAYAHERGVVHRDIKPANLLLSKEGTVKILDMGLARFESNDFGDADATEARQLTKSGQMMGTVDYMSPEQAEDTRAADHRADIYSLGCTLFRLLVGAPVFEGDTVMKKLIGHREAPIPSLRAARADVPEALDTVFQQMLAKEPGNRQQSMGEVIDQIEASLDRDQSPEPRVSAESTSSGLTEFFDQIGQNGGGRTQQEAPAVTSEDTVQYRVTQDTDTETRQRRAKNTKQGKLKDASPLVSLIRKRNRPHLIAVGAGLAVIAVCVVILLTRENDPVDDADNVQPAANTPKSRGDEHGTPTGQVKYALEFTDWDTLATAPVRVNIDEDFCLEAWVTPSGKKNWTGHIFQLGDELVLRYGNHNLWTMVGSRIYLGTKPTVSTTRTHIAAVKRGDQALLFVDGKLAAQRAYRVQTPPVETSWILVGAGDGRMDEAKVSQTAQYTGDFTPRQRFAVDQHTLAIYHFDKGQGDVLRDSSGNDHHAEIFGARWVKLRDELNFESPWIGKTPPPAVAPFNSALAEAYQFAWAKHLRLPTEKVIILGAEKMAFKLIPPGEFVMGSSAEEQARFRTIVRAAKNKFTDYANEGPQRKFQVKEPFYLAKHEFTVAQWKAINPTGEAELDKGDQTPVGLTWNTAMSLAEQLNEKFPQPNLTFEVPWETQWEYACRAGSTTAYFFGDSPVRLGEYALFDLPEYGSVQSVGQKKPNPWGLFDILGNANEWCSNPLTSGNPERALRGGSHDGGQSGCRSASRFGAPPDAKYRHFGVRLAMSIDVAKLKLSATATPNKKNSMMPSHSTASAAMSGFRSTKTTWTVRRHRGVGWRGSRVLPGWRPRAAHRFP